MDDQQQRPDDDQGTRPPGPYYGDVPRYGSRSASGQDSRPEAPLPPPAAPWHQSPTSAPFAPPQSAPVSAPAPYGPPSSPPYAQGPDAQNQHAPSQYGQNPYAQNPYAQNPYAQNPYAQNPYAATPPMSSPPPPNLATWGRRVGAYLIDFAPALVAQAVFYVGYFQWIISVTQLSSTSTSLPTAGLPAMAIGGVLLLAALGWQIYNRWITAGRTGQSLGKRVVKLRLVAEQGLQPIGPLNAFLRDLVHVLDGFAYVGFLWPLWDERRQTFADKLMKTYVLTDAPGSPPSS